jgi:hypothetical protein
MLNIDLIGKSFPVDRIMAQIPDLGGKIDMKTRVDIEGFNIKPGTCRMQLFKNKGTTCYECGAVADRWEVGVDNHRVTFVLMAGNREMIQGRVVPKSLGGGHTLGNSEPMCYECHEKRLNNILGSKRYR